MDAAHVFRGDYAPTPAQLQRFPPAGFPGTFFGSLDSTARKDLLKIGRIREHAPREEIFTQGESSVHVLLLLEGSVKLTVRTDTGTDSLLAIRSSGDLLDVVGMIHMVTGAQPGIMPAAAPGELTTSPDGGVSRASHGRTASVSDAVRNATASTLDFTTTLVVRVNAFTRFMQAHPEAWIVACRDLAAAITKTEERLVRRDGRNANARLAEALLSLSLEEVGVPGRGHPGTKILLSQPELASWIGVSTKTIERIIKDWRARGIVATEYRAIVITDLRTLMRIAGVLLKPTKSRPRTASQQNTPRAFQQAPMSTGEVPQIELPARLRLGGDAFSHDWIERAFGGVRSPVPDRSGRPRPSASAGPALAAGPIPRQRPQSGNVSAGASSSTLDAG